MREVLVIGSVLLDIVATYGSDMEQQRNKIGVLRYSVGGVGYNIAANLATKGVPTSFLTCLKRNSLSTRTLRPVLESTGFKSLYIEEADHIVEPAYVAHSLEGKLTSGVTSCQIEKVGLDTEMLVKAIKKSALVVVETNLSFDQIRQIAEISSDLNTPLLVSVVSDAKADRIYRQAFPCTFDLVALNADEAGYLGLSVEAEAAPSTVSSICADFNSSKVFVTRGKKGYLMLKKSGEVRDIPADPPANYRNDIGAGDALFAALCAARLQGEQLLDSHETRSRVTDWVTAVMTRDESNLGPTDFGTGIASRGSQRRAFLVLGLSLTSAAAIVLGTFVDGVTPALFGACLFTCSIAAGSAGALIRDLRALGTTQQCVGPAWSSLTLGMTAGLFSSLLFILPHLSVGETAQNLRTDVNDLNLLVILSFIVSFSAGFGIEAFYAGLSKGDPSRMKLPVDHDL